MPNICLDFILSYLDIKELTNAADADTVLSSSAVRIFKLKFKKEVIERTEETDEMFLKTLKHFGPQIEMLHVTFYGSADEDVLRTIQEQCSQTVTDLNVSITAGVVLNYQFPNLKSLTLNLKSDCYGDIDDSWTDINRWFPSVSEIHIDDYKSNLKVSESLVSHVPNLESLIMEVKNSTPENLIIYDGFISANRNVNFLAILTEDNETFYINNEIVPLP